VLEKVTKNALDFMNISGLIGQKSPPKFKRAQTTVDWREHSQFGGLRCPLLIGCRKPLLRPGVICEEIHGESGLEGTKFPPIPEHALHFTSLLNNADKHFTTRMHEILQSAPRPVTIITTGPLTNIALLLINYPDSGKYISKIVSMGGAMGVGNTGPVAEFNIQVDPEAAQLVFHSKIACFLVPLEVTHTVLVSEQILDRIRSLETKYSEEVVKLLCFFKSTYESVFGFREPPLHDPTAVAFVIEPAMFSYKLLRLDVEVGSTLSYGQTVCDIYNLNGKEKNVHVCHKMDVDKFWEMMLHAIAEANKNSPVNLG
jgi:purine nucleosidase/pyrimidine-specific ribonucleoside hydrolase